MPMKFQNFALFYIWTQCILFAHSVDIPIRGHFHAKAWKASFEYPDSNDYPETKFLSDKVNAAIGFSGGGARAFVAAFGYLSALHELNLLKNVKYIGGISGGGWATLTYSFAQNITDDDLFLCPIVYPADIRYEDLKKMDPQCARRLASADLSLIALQALKDGKVDSPADSWIYGVSKTYLEPMGIPRNKYLSWNEATVKDILDRNSGLTREDFITVNQQNNHRAFPLVGTNLVGPSIGAPYGSKNQNYSMIEITPLYVGQMKNLDIDYYTGRTGRIIHSLVGGAVESFAFNKAGGSPLHGLATGQKEGVLNVPVPTENLDVAISAGACSYAPGSFVESFHPHRLATDLGMEFDYWSPSDPSPQARHTLFADGGSYENIPLISFIQRRVPKIVLFFMSRMTLKPFSDWDVETDPYSDDQITNDLSAFFGALQATQSRFTNRSYEYEKDQVFATEDYDRVVHGLQAAQAAGRGIIATFNLTTIENKWWGVPAGLTFEITFSYLGRLAQWENELSPEMRALVVPKDGADDLSVEMSHGPFRSFPNYFTTGGAINYERANLLGNLAGWSVLQHKELFQSIFSKP